MIKCQCDDTGELNPGMASLYDINTELPFVDHEPNECRGTNDLQLYERAGKKLWLCSNCNLSTDKILTDEIE